MADIIKRMNLFTFFSASRRILIYISVYHCLIILISYLSFILFWFRPHPIKNIYISLSKTFEYYNVFWTTDHMLSTYSTNQVTLKAEELLSDLSVNVTSSRSHESSILSKAIQVSYVTTHLKSEVSSKSQKNNRYH